MTTARFASRCTGSDALAEAPVNQCWHHLSLCVDGSGNLTCNAWDLRTARMQAACRCIPLSTYNGLVILCITMEGSACLCTKCRAMTSTHTMLTQLHMRALPVTCLKCFLRVHSSLELTALFGCNAYRGCALPSVRGSVPVLVVGRCQPTCPVDNRHKFKYAGPISRNTQHTQNYVGSPMYDVLVKSLPQQL